MRNSLLSLVLAVCASSTAFAQAGPYSSPAPSPAPAEAPVVDNGIRGVRVGNMPRIKVAGAAVPQVQEHLRAWQSAVRQEFRDCFYFTANATTVRAKAKGLLTVKLVYEGECFGYVVSGKELKTFDLDKGLEYDVGRLYVLQDSKTKALVAPLHAQATQAIRKARALSPDSRECLTDAERHLNTTPVTLELDATTLHVHTTPEDAESSCGTHFELPLSRLAPYLDTREASRIRWTAP